MEKHEYKKLIKRDLEFLEKNCPNSDELKHIKLLLNSSIDWLYPDAAACRALRKIESRIVMELEIQRAEGKEILSDEEIESIIDGIIKKVN